MLASAVTVLHLILAPASDVRDLKVTAIVEQARRIWQPLLDIRLGAPPGMAGGGGIAAGGPDDGRRARALPQDSMVLRWTIADDLPSGPSGEALGWIAFVDGVPEPAVTVSRRRAMRVVEGAQWMGRALRFQLPALQNQMVERALGRALAHEIGHYVLRSSAHTADGLMRATFRDADLLDGSTRRVSLTRAQRADAAMALAVPLRASLGRGAADAGDANRR